MSRVSDRNYRWTAYVRPVGNWANRVDDLIYHFEPCRSVAPSSVIMFMGDDRLINFPHLQVRRRLRAGRRSAGDYGSRRRRAGRRRSHPLPADDGQGTVGSGIEEWLYFGIVKIFCTYSWSEIRQLTLRWLRWDYGSSSTTDFILMITVISRRPVAASSWAISCLCSTIWSRSATWWGWTSCGGSRSELFVLTFEKLEMRCAKRSIFSGIKIPSKCIGQLKHCYAWCWKGFCDGSSRWYRGSYEMEWGCSSCGGGSRGELFIYVYFIYIFATMRMIV